jgi:hypothetical protein
VGRKKSIIINYGNFEKELNLMESVGRKIKRLLKTLVGKDFSQGWIVSARKSGSALNTVDGRLR